MFAIVFQLLGFVFAVAEQQHYSEPFSFHCSSRYEDITQSVLVFYLKDGPLTIHCQLYDPFLDTAESRKQMTYKYHILAHRPSITFSNSTWRKTFQFDTEVDWEEMTWVTTIPKEDISDDVVASREQWSVIIELDSNLDLFTVHGTLLDTLTDPIFHWDMGPRASHVAGDLVTGQMTLVHTPCESDHVLIMLQTQYGSLLGPSTAPYKTVESVTWYNMTEALCIDGSACSGLTVYDMVLTNDHLIILTNRGLYVSNQMTSVNNSHTQLTYTRVDNGTELESHCIADESSHLYYSEVCSRQLDEKVKDDVVLVKCLHNSSSSLESLVLISKAPFTDWTKPLSGIQSGQEESLVDVTYQSHMGAISALTERMGSYTVTTYVLNSSLAFDAGHCFPPFTFPETFQVKSLTFDPITGVLYVLGNQVWVSYNGISHFQHMLTLGGQHGQVDSVQFSHNTGSLLMKTTTGTILYGKTGISRLAVVHEATQSEQSNITTIQASHVGTMYRVWVDSSTLELHRQKIDVQQKMMSLDWSFSRPLAIQYLSDSEVVIFEHVAEGEIPTQAVPRFSDSNVGQAFSLKKGGSGIIHHVIYPAEPWSGFVSRVLLRVREPFHHESMGESPAQAFNLGIVPVNANGSEVMLTLTGGQENSTGWVTSDIGKTAIVVGHPNVLILDVVNDTVATGHPVLAVREEVQVLTRAWYMMNLGNSSSESAWYVKEDRCRHALMTDTKLNGRSVVALDLGDNFTVKAEVEFITSVGQEEQYGSLLEVTSSNAILFATHTQSLVKGSGLSVLLENEEFRKGVTTLTFYIPTASLLCEKTSYTVTAQACCPGNKFLVFHYPTLITDEDYLTGDPQDAKGIKLLSDLPPNYRPPSQLGIAIPLTANMYHADPSKPREKNTYQISKQSGKYKQCAGKTTRDECGCTRAMKLSNLVKFSDCKERVYSLHHPAHLDLNFSIEQEGKPERLLREPYIYRVYELNDRVDYSVSTTMTPMLTHIRHYDKIKNSTIWYAAEGTELILTGTGLYHMRVSLIHGMSFCDLEAELQVYVIGSPIPYPVMYMINLGGGTVLLGILFLVYLVYLHGHHTFRERKLGPLCKELHDPIFREERRNLHD